MRIGYKVLVIGLLSSIVPLIILGMICYNQSNNIMHNQIESEISSKMSVLNSLTNEIYKQNLRKLQTDISVLENLLYRQGNVNISKTSTKNVTVKNQVSKETSELKLDDMVFGKKKILNNNEIVDLYYSKFGVSATIFQRFNGGLLRVSTNIYTLGGKRAVGTFIPTDSPVYKSIINNQTFLGNAFVVDRYFISAYQPIVDEDNKVIGAIYVGRDLNKEMMPVLSHLESEKIGNEGKYFIINSRGNIVYHPNKKGEALASKNYIKDIISQKKGIMKYHDNGENLIGFTYVKALDWYICGGSTTADFFSELKELSRTTIYILLITIIIVLTIFYLLSHNISKKIKYVVDEVISVTETVKQGHLKAKGNVEGIPIDFVEVINEINELIDTLEKPMLMTSYYLEKIAKGEIPNKVTDKYEGDFDKIKGNINECVDVMNNLVASTDYIVESVEEGKLETQALLNGLFGVWNNLISSINRMGRSFVSHLDAVPAPVMIIDTDMNVLFMNAKGAETIGKPKDQIKGEKCYNQFNTGDCKNGNCAAAKAIKSDMIHSSETQAQIKFGELDMMYTAAPIKDKNGKVIGGLEIVIDQTARKIIERKDRKIEEFQNKEVEKISVILDKMSKGDLSNKYVISNTDSDAKDAFNNFKTIGENLNNSLNSINKILNQVNIAVDQVSSASNQISSESQNLAMGASVQVSSLEEVASNLEEMNSLIANNADNAKECKSLADDAISVVNNGSESMNELNIAMQEISKSSEETHKILKTIDEIAFQTNLLALNAAVEAAHAGEAGKGFAVVAEEVKNLALRSAEAAKDTEILIEQAKTNSNSGMFITNQVNESFKGIKNSFDKVNRIVGEIAAASDEQTQGISQINVGVSELNKVVQQSAANAEESASASEELNSQADELRTMVGEFQLNEEYQLKSKRQKTNKRKSISYEQPKNYYEVDPNNVIPLSEDEIVDF